MRSAGHRPSRHRVGPRLPGVTWVYTRVGDSGRADGDGAVGHVPDEVDADAWEAGTVHWSPRLGETAALVVVALGLGLALLVLDAPGRVLVGAGALLLLALAAHDVLARPRLTAGPDGVDVRTWARRHHLPWSRLRVRVRESRRLGVRSRTLELDTAAGPDDDGVLVVLGRRDLGAEPDEVAQALRALDPTAP
jgi:hypothetical protein